VGREAAFGLSIHDDETDQKKEDTHEGHDDNDADALGWGVFIYRSFYTVHFFK
jgi:hypothetical protein